jgi:hypothetical protein
MSAPQNIAAICILHTQQPGDAIAVVHPTGLSEKRAGVSSCHLTPRGELIFLKHGAVVGILSQGEWKSVELIEAA